MLIACSSCHRQYDVGDLRPGSAVRCACGTANTVPRARPRRVAVQHCANCGGVRDGEGPCPYCGARPSATEKGLGDPCPECFARLARSARFCHGCGTEIRPAAVVRAVTSTSCPRCQGGLVQVEGRGDPFHQCSACGGVWLSRRAFQRFVDRSAGRAVSPEEQRSTAAGVRRRAIGGRGKLSPTRRRRSPTRPSISCPTCAETMLTTAYATYSGVLIDACARHGWWFDGDELERIGKFVAGGGLEEAERRRRSARRVRRTTRSWRQRIGADRRRARAAWIVLLLDLLG
jgi:Zn-finger nucleic acid-binding protein